MEPNENPSGCANAVPKEPPARLYRYVPMPVMMDYLFNRRITLVNPCKWPDKNDSGLMELYRKEKGLNEKGGLLALCFTTEPDLVHFWNGKGTTFRIEFDGKLLLETADREKLRHDYVQYWPIKEARTNIANGKIKLDDWPFTKRLPYKCEREYRIIRESHEDCPDFLEVALPEGCVTRVTADPSMKPEMYEKIKAIIEGQTGFSCWHSTLEENRQWLGSFKNATEAKPQSADESGCDR